MAKVARRPRWATVAATAVFLSSFIQARATTVYTSEASSLQNMTRGKNPIELQIVRAVFKIKNTEVPFNRSRLNHVYHTYEAEKMQKADEELKNRGLFTIRYILIDGTNAVSPCRGHSNNNEFIRDSLLVAPSNLSQCSQVCNLKPTNSGQVTSVMYNVLFKTGPICSSDNGVAYQLVHLNKTKGNWTRVDDKGFQWTSTTNVQEVNVLLKLKNLMDITRLWFSLNAQSALPDIGQSNSSYNYTFFNMSCDRPHQDTKLPDCVDVTATTSTAPTLTVQYPQDSTTQQTESPIESLATIITVVVAVVGLIAVTIIIAVTVCLVKRSRRRSSDSTTLTNNSSGRRAATSPARANDRRRAPTTAEDDGEEEEEEDHDNDGDDDHKYSSLQRPASNSTGDNNASGRKIRRLHKTDYKEDWVLPQKPPPIPPRRDDANV